MERGLPLSRNEDAFSDDESSASANALDVVLFHEVRRVGMRRTVSRKRRHAHSILDGNVSNCKRGIEVSE